jgi:quinol monooxygenase YgiN
VTLRIAVLITTQPGKGQEQIDAFTRLVPTVRAEPGCIQYDLHQVEGDPDRFVILEQWESEEALSAHNSAPHMVAARTANQAFRAKPAELLRLSTHSLA